MKFDNDHPDYMKMIGEYQRLSRVFRGAMVEDFGTDYAMGSWKPHKSAPQEMKDAWKRFPKVELRDDRRQWIGYRQNIITSLDGTNRRGESPLKMSPGRVRMVNSSPSTYKNVMSHYCMPEDEFSYAICSLSRELLGTWREELLADDDYYKFRETLWAEFQNLYTSKYTNSERKSKLYERWMKVIYPQIEALIKEQSELESVKALEEPIEIVTPKPTPAPSDHAGFAPDFTPAKFPDVEKQEAKALDKEIEKMKSFNEKLKKEKQMEETLLAKVRRWFGEHPHNKAHTDKFGRVLAALGDDVDYDPMTSFQAKTFLLNCRHQGCRNRWGQIVDGLEKRERELVDRATMEAINPIKEYLDNLPEDLVEYIGEEEMKKLRGHEKQTHAAYFTTVKGKVEQKMKWFAASKPGIKNQEAHEKQQALKDQAGTIEWANELKRRLLEYDNRFWSDYKPGAGSPDIMRNEYGSLKAYWLNRDKTGVQWESIRTQFPAGSQVTTVTSANEVEETPVGKIERLVNEYGSTVQRFLNETFRGLKKTSSKNKAIIREYNSAYYDLVEALEALEALVRENEITDLKGITPLHAQAVKFSQTAGDRDRMNVIGRRFMYLAYWEKKPENIPPADPYGDWYKTLKVGNLIKIPDHIRLGLRDKEWPLDEAKILYDVYVNM